MNSIVSHILRIVKRRGIGAKRMLAVLLALQLSAGSLPLDALVAYASQADQSGSVVAASETESQNTLLEQPLVEPGDSSDLEAVEQPAVESEEADIPEASAPAAQPSQELVTLTYEDETLVATATAPASVLPGGAGLVVEEVVPVDAESADAYAEALTSLSGALREKDMTYSSATVYDIKVVDASGNEIEPLGDVQITLSYKEALPLGNTAAGEAGPAADVAHLTEDGGVSMMEADMATNSEGDLEEASFATSSFSYYIVFGQNNGSTSEPVNIGNYGWVKLATPDSSADWGYYPPQGPLPPLGTEDAYRRIVQIRLWMPKTGGDEASYDSDNYELVQNSQVPYFWTWENQIHVDDFFMPDHEVLHTRMHTAWDDPSNDKQNDSLIDTYEVRGWQSADNTSSDLNVLDVYIKPATEPQNAMRYIVRYVHADGSISDGNVRYLGQGQSAAFDAESHRRAGEVYSGAAVITGADAVTIDDYTGSGSFNYNANTDIAKVYIYYKMEPTNNGNPNDRGRYDKDENGYYTGELGLYTDKRAEPIGEGETRDFMLTLESWYIASPASVGMILDASGSMPWTTGTPAAITRTDAEWAQLLGWDWWRYTTSDPNTPPTNTITADTLNRLGIMDVHKTDNTTMGYNGFHYYVYDPRNTIREYVALGYSEDRTVGQGSDSAPDGIIYPSAVLHQPVYSRRYNGPGWYFVNSQHNDLSITGKSYEGLNNSGGPARFYIYNNQLWCEYWDGESANNQNIVKHSAVYEKRDTMFTKMETLQDAVAQFGAILLGSSPTSQIAMTRFSTGTNRLPDNHHVLQTWTSSSIDVADALDQPAASDFSTTGESVPASGSNPEFSEYVYGLTAQTNTYRGIDAFNTFLRGRVPDGNDRYLIIFTDGKDTRDTDPSGQRDGKSSDADRDGWGYSGQLVRELQAEPYNYTVITVLMKSLAMDMPPTTPGGRTDYESARDYLQGLASLDENDKPLYFEASSDSAHEMVEQFRQIAHYIGNGLSDYSVRDYIDPRYDVVNNAGQVLSVLDENGEFTQGVETEGEYAGYERFTTPDGKQALLGYDPDRKMFYVLWQHQDIPATDRGSESVVNLWRGQVHVRAKEDFLGGNDVLTNGNEPELNTVYKPQASDPLAIDTSAEYKDFPMATANPATLSVSLSNYEDTVFLGEDVSPYALYQKVAQQSSAVADDGTQWYIDYLERFGIEKHNSADYYAGILRDGTPGTAAAGETVTITDGTITITLPYYYLDAGEIINGHTVYAGSEDRHQADQVGTLTYTWKMVENENTAAPTFDDFATDVTDDIRYELTVKYEPLPVGEAGSGNDGSPRTDALTETTDGKQYKDTRGNNAGTHNTLVRDTVGTEMESHETTDREGIAVVHVVDGRIHVVKRVRKDEFDALRAIAAQSGITAFTFTLTGPAGTDRITGTIPIPTSAEGLTEDGDYYIIYDHWFTGLAQGTWTLVEEQPSGFDTPTYALSTYTGTDEPTNPYNSSAANFAAIGTAGTGLSWEIGVTPVVETPFYPASDFSYAAVTDTTGAYKGVDRTQGADVKPYLNAQIGEGTITNTLKTTSIEVEKTWVGTQPPAGTTIVVKLTGSNGSTHYVALGAENGWKGRVTGLYIDGATYTAVEGMGTVNPDGTCTDFAPYEDPLELGGKTYGITITYDDVAPAGVTPATDAVTANTEPLAGTVSITNQEVTQVTVTKVWEGGAPDAAIVVKLVGSDGTELYHELDAENSWTYTFENLPIKNGVTYTVVEGSGTVQDGTCADFVAFNTGEDGFVVGGKEYVQVGIVYADADGASLEDGLDGSVGPNAGSATITNMTVYSLPSAGGPGVYPFLLFGAFAATYAASGALGGKRKRPNQPPGGPVLPGGT